MPAFVELDRAFAPYKNDSGPIRLHGRKLGLRIGGWRTWPQLLKRRRIVVLAEASSGKSAEFAHRAEQLVNEGRAAFLVRIEELASVGLMGALGGAASDRMESWLKGSEAAWFFLDSIDEARLNRKGFDTALKQFSRALHSHLHRLHVYISCRVSDWCGEDDRKLIQDLLAYRDPVPAPVTISKSTQQLLLDPFIDTQPTGQVMSPVKLDSVEIYQLVALEDDSLRRNP